MLRILAKYAAALALAALSAAAQEPTLKVGDPAPALQVGKWIQGEPVKGFATGTVYVVEFWATWCPPCRASIPHLSKLQEKLKDKGVVIIGQNVGEEESEVAEFVKKMGDKMTYRVALDDASKVEGGAMNKDWMDASGQQGIPCSFVVDKAGRIAWIGHPMAGLDEVAEGVAAGTFDPAKEAERAKAEEAKKQALMEKYQKVMEAAQAMEWDKAIQELDALMATMEPEDAKGLAYMRFKFLIEKKDVIEAVKQAEKVAEAFNDTPEALNAIAWTLVTDRAFEKPDLAVAEKIAKAANEAAKGEEPAILDTLARVTFLKGEKDAAIKLQEQAVAKADEAEAKASLQKTLDSYKEGKLPPAEE